MSQSPNPQMEKYAATKNLENRLIAYSVMIIGIVLSVAAFIFAVGTGNAAAVLIVGVPSALVFGLCIMGIRRIARNAKV